MAQVTKETDQEADPGGAPYLCLEHISKSFRHVQALNDVTIEIDKNEVVGIVGENGAGKSTLLNILTGIYAPDQGQIVIDEESVTIGSPQEAANYGISLVQQEQSTIPNLTGMENLFLGNFNSFTKFGKLDKRKMRSESQKFIDELNISLPLDKRVSQYSFDQRQMLEITRAFYAALHSSAYPTILLDEPTAGLEEEGRKKLFQRIRELKGRASFVFISHELDEVITICDRIYVLKDGEIVTEVPAMDTTPDELKELMVGRTGGTGEYYHLSKQLPEAELGNITLRINELKTDDVGPISFEARKGEIFGIVGVEGSGKEKLGRMLAGATPIESGSLYVDDDEVTDHTVQTHIDAGIGYIPKDRTSEGLLLYQPLVLNAMLPSIREFNGVIPITDRGKEESQTAEIIEDLDVKTPGLKEQAVNLSGGNQQKIILGRWLQRDLPILVMDNVSRGLDVGVKEEVYRICRELSQEGYTIVFIGDELPEVINMSNRIGVMKQGQLRKILDAPAEDKPTEQELIREMV